MFWSAIPLMFISHPWTDSFPGQNFYPKLIFSFVTFVHLDFGPFERSEFTSDFFNVFCLAHADQYRFSSKWFVSQRPFVFFIGSKIIFRYICSFLLNNDNEFVYHRTIYLRKYVYRASILPSFNQNFGFSSDDKVARKVSNDTIYRCLYDAWVLVSRWHVVVTTP